MRRYEVDRGASLMISVLDKGVDLAAKKIAQLLLMI